MSIQILRPGETYESIATGLPTGQAGTTIKVKVEGATELVAPTFDYIDEPEPTNYRVRIPIPSDAPAGTYLQYWSPDAGATWRADQDIIYVQAIGELGDLRPSLTEIGALLPARTRDDRSGSSAGTFTDTTNPTAEQVNIYIDQAHELVALRLGNRVPDNIYSSARLAITLRAAFMVELGLLQDDAGGDDNAYDRFKKLYDELMIELQDSLEDTDTATTNRVASPSVVSPTLAHLPDDMRRAMQGPYV